MELISMLFNDQLKKLILAIFIMAVAGRCLAIDIAPYKEGQVLNASQATELQQRYNKRDKQAWRKASSIESLAGHKNAALILYGIKVLDKTVLTIGPALEDKSMRYSANGLNCSSCHLKGESKLPGTQYDAIPFTNVANDYPQFRKRGMSVVSAAQRVNGCMTRSMGNGLPLAVDSKEMQGILAYFSWLAQGTEKNLSMQGTGLPAIKFPAREADSITGKKIYQQFCISCHAKNAMGTKAADYNKTRNYIFPPLAHDDSFNNGAGMSRLKKATQFIHANMPLGTTSKSPMLSVEQAYDVASYMLSLDRPEKSNRENDFPDPKFRPNDYPVAEYFNGDKAALKKARSGPYEN